MNNTVSGFDKYWQLKMNAAMEQAKKSYESAKKGIERLAEYEEGLNLLAFPFLRNYGAILCEQLP